MSLWTRLTSVFGAKDSGGGLLHSVPTDDCDHIYFPVGEPLIGQECSLCGKFNSLHDLGMKSFEEYKEEMAALRAARDERIAREDQS